MWTELETPMGPMRIVAQDGAITAAKLAVSAVTTTREASWM